MKDDLKQLGFTIITIHDPNNPKVTIVLAKKNVAMFEESHEDEAVALETIYNRVQCDI